MDIMSMTVNEALSAAPETSAIFNRLGVDTCCGGTLTLAEAARSIGLEAEQLRAEIEPALAQRQ